MVKIYTELSKHVAVDIVEDIFQPAGQLVVDEVIDGHMAGGVLFIQQPQKANVCFA